MDPLETINSIMDLLRSKLSNSNDIDTVVAFNQATRDILDILVSQHTREYSVAHVSLENIPSLV